MLQRMKDFEVKIATPDTDVVIIKDNSASKEDVLPVKTEQHKDLYTQT